MPSDLTGHSIYDMNERRFHFNPGPIFAHFCGRRDQPAPPKTQSACSNHAGRQVTVDGKCYRPIAFLVLATQNPLEHEGRTAA